MRLIVFGATGASGQAVIEQAPALGHEVTAFVRSPDYQGPPNVKVVRGSVLDAAAVTEAIRGQDAVFSGLGTRPWHHEDICSQGLAVICAAMAATGVKRLIALSTQGIGNSSVGMAKPLVWLFLRKSFADKAVMEQALAATDLEWTVLRPGKLTNGAPRGTWRTAVDGSLVGGKICRKDVAALALKELAERQFIKQAPTVVW